MNLEQKRNVVSSFLHGNKELLNGEQTLEHIFEVSTGNYFRKKLAFISFDGEGKQHKVSYKQYREKCFDFAARLSSLLGDKGKDSVVGLKVKNCAEWPMLFWAILMSGHRPLLLNAGLAKENANNLLKQSGAVAIIAGDENEYIVDKVILDDINNVEANPSFVPTWSNEVIFCSSGTTGDAKMAIYEGKNLCAQILASSDMGNETLDIMYLGQIRNFAMIPFHHIFGFVAVFLWYTFYGKTLVFPASNATNDLLTACQKGKVTHLYSVPLFWDSLALTLQRTAASLDPKKKDILDKMIAYNTKQIGKEEAELGAKKFVMNKFKKKLLGSKVVYCISGGGYLSEATAKLINGLGYPLYNGYGMTEIGVTSVELSADVKDRLKCSIGKPLHGVTYKIVPVEGRESSDGSGELFVKTDITHTKEFLGGKEVKTTLDEYGFFSTGDIAILDEDNRCYIKGRIKDTIILSNGENVYPDEIEDYFKRIKNVKNVVCLGAKPKGEKEEMIVLALEISGSIRPEDIAELKASLKKTNEGLASEKRVQKFFFAKHPLPISNSMKVRRVEVKADLEKGSDNYMDIDGKKKEVSFEGYDPKKVEEVREKVRKIFSEVLLLPVDKIEHNSDWGADLSGDSMSYMEMIQALEAEFNITIEDNLFGLLMTVDDFTKDILDRNK